MQKFLTIRRKSKSFEYDISPSTKEFTNEDNPHIYAMKY